MLLRGDKGHPARSGNVLSGDKQSAGDPADDMNDDKRCAGCTAYGTSTLTNSYLTRLSNANHDGVTKQIYVGGDGADDYDPNAN